MEMLTADIWTAARTSAEIRYAIEASGGPLPPAFIVQFLLGDWRHYLTSTLNACGEDSEEARATMETTALLLWSARPVPTEALVVWSGPEQGTGARRYGVQWDPKTPEAPHLRRLISESA